MKIGFRPLKPQNYSITIPFFIQNEPKPYSKLKLKGEGAYPKILFDQSEVILKPVPLGVDSSKELILLNDGYQNTNFNISIAEEYSQIPLNVDFLNGSSIGINNPKLRVKINFCSPKPISFTTKLNFEDENKRTFTIFVSGTADNSLFSTYIFHNFNLNTPFNSTNNFIFKKY